MRLAANLGIGGMLSQAQCCKNFDPVKLTLCKVFESEKHFHPSLTFVSGGEPTYNYTTMIRSYKPFFIAYKGAD